ncbi:hypothetical protein BGX28_009139 [Mortierella sp. GBA30]|nr:hypothetical protein BGX28_009139 [Mortierella sp. GBA30]
MATRSARTADKSVNDKHSRILKALLQKPGNKYCVDCRKKDPRWASVCPLYVSFNLGCFMCIRCSGVHRSMGTHISKVKSVDLDSWTTEQVENMIKWGNEKANLYWEARLPESSIPNENTSGIDSWIRSKYEWKQFASKGEVPDPSELGPIDEAMLMDLHGKSDRRRSRDHANRSSGSSESFGIIAPPPSNPSRLSFPKRPSSVVATGVQGADLFALGQEQRPSSANSRPTSVVHEDFFGLNDHVPNHSTQTQASKRVSLPPPQQQQQQQQRRQPQHVQNSASQDLFSLVTPAPSSGQLAGQIPQAIASNPMQQTKAGGADWKNSIMSLYGNQNPTSNRTSIGFNLAQQQPQQQQQQQIGQIGQLQGMNAFGFGQQQHSLWGNDDGFRTTQQAYGVSSATSFNTFSMGSNANANTNTNTNSGFGGQFNQPAKNTAGMGHSNATPQGGDFFNMLANASQPSVTSPHVQNKKTR